MNKAYKVVYINDSKERVSAWLGYQLYHCNYKFNDIILKYPINSYVIAPENSMGIMCFDNHDNADNFRKCLPDLHSEFKIIEVSYDCEPKKFKYVLSSYPDELIHLIKDKQKIDYVKKIKEEVNIHIHDNWFLTPILEGTICLDKVFCLT